MGAPGREMPGSRRQSDDGSGERRNDHFLTRRRELLTYLRLTNKRVGLLINFGGNTLVDGLRRVVNDLPPSASPRLRVNQSAEPSSARHWLEPAAAPVGPSLTEQH